MLFLKENIETWKKKLSYDYSALLLKTFKPLKRQEKYAFENGVCWSGLLQIIA